ncbi:hypothetical protein TTHERM_001609734 (macronuclear) [Tetrahymena thermophila SB210]|uniref:Uncharacterized protein n=1 Tax=Tetrahymena thermophila (strain SB210) TaxID=312017 RepID=W7XGG7_TETTS|nr:hypothetical protein TTHERM_001609734 [Tetrahymena thermophila SB210]EWS73236.1 hypothetical protein TTHERM_001609734 [Tetrahymena thermophila SB210]|eukprot:XP_012654229.1 hypothetical protein TTHERM_001609734 [Tetrahymena thermophila SB210]
MKIELLMKLLFSNKYVETQQNFSYLNCDNKQLKVLLALQLQTYNQYLKFKDIISFNVIICINMLRQKKVEIICCSKQKVFIVDPVSYQLIRKEIKRKSTKNQELRKNEGIILNQKQIRKIQIIQ